MQDSIRAELIKQFPAEVVETTTEEEGTYYMCPTCKHAVALKYEKCDSCGQVLSWDHIRREEKVKGTRIAALKFEVTADFSKGDCRKCPLSYIARENNESVYQCPLKMRANCKLEIS